MARAIAQSVQARRRSVFMADGREYLKRRLDHDLSCAGRARITDGGLIR
jgi:hypothetical protein